jgi:hypothetical protein
MGGRKSGRLQTPVAVRPYGPTQIIYADETTF